MSRVQELLARNVKFAEEGSHMGVAPLPSLGLFVVSCLDARVDPAHFLGVRSGEALVLRNAGGRVNSEVLREVAFIALLTEQMFGDEAPGFEVAVIHHTGCGSAFLADPDFRGKFAGMVGVEEAGLEDAAVTDPEASVRSDVQRLLDFEAIPERVTASGHVYDVDTGLVSTVVPAVADSGR